MLTIRPMQQQDIDPCARLMAENELWQRYQVTQESAARRLQSGLDQQADLLVAEQDGQVCGFVWYVTRGAFQRSGYIMLIGVDPKIQSAGIGAELLTTAEERMAASVSDVLLLVSDFNTRAQRFYNRQGYHQVGALSDYVIPGVSELIFRKSLKKG